MKDKIGVCVGIALWVLATPAIGLAENGTTENYDNVFLLGEIEVSAKSEKDTNTTVERIYADELRNFNRNTVADAATLLPGVTSSMTGSRNEQTLHVRGFDIKHVPLFFDGIPIYVPYDGYPDLGRFTTFDLSEVVVSKGFTSVLYGPNTMGGAINMVSRRPGKFFEGDIGVGYSTGASYNTYMNIGTNQNTWYLQGGVSYLSSDYFRLSDDFKSTSAEDGDHRENSYHRDEKINFKVGFTPNGDDEYTFSYIYQHGEKGTPPYSGISPSVRVRYWQWPYWDKESYYFTSKTNFKNKAYLKTRIYYDTFENSLYSYDDSTYTTISKRYAFRSWYNDYTYGGSAEVGSSFIPNNLIKLALHYKSDVHREQNEGDPQLTFKDRMLSIGLEDTITFSEKFYAITGISYDTIKTLDAEDLTSSGEIVDFEKGSTSGLNPQLGLFFTPADNHTVHASISWKTRLPSIKDKYSFRLGTAIPNPDLDPEKSINYELGYANSQFDNLRMKGTFFYNNVTDFIQFATVTDPTNPGVTVNQNQNIGEVDLTGIELELTGYLLPSLEAGTNYTYTHSDNKTDSSKLTNVPEHKVVAYLRYVFWNHLSSQLDGEYNSKRYSSSDGTRVASKFTVVNAKLAYDFDNGFQAEAGMKNIFDKDYELQEGYSQPGRTLFVNVHYTF